MVRGLSLGDKKAFLWYTGDPEWDMKYMKEAGENWLIVAVHWYYTEPEDRKGNGRKRIKWIRKSENKKPFFLPFTAEQLHLLEAKVKRPSIQSKINVSDLSPTNPFLPTTVSVFPLPLPPVYTPLYPSIPVCKVSGDDEEIIQIATLAIGNPTHPPTAPPPLPQQQVLLQAQESGGSGSGDSDVESEAGSEIIVKKKMSKPLYTSLLK